MNIINNKVYSYFIILVCSLLAFGVKATEVSEDKAKLVATNYLRFLTKQPIKRSGDLVKLVYSAKKPSVKRAISAPSFYIFNQIEGKGFVIVSGDDNIKPILGYSLESNFDAANISPQLAYWLSEYEKQIAFAVESNLQNTIQNQQWEMISTNQIPIKRGTTAVKPLLKTTWDQGKFYNDSCPYDNTANKRVPVGCVATAMAQTMKYWGYPSDGVGSTSYTHATYGVLKANFGASKYNWSAMTNKVGSANSEVARLMYHCGVSINMNYGPDGSGAWATYDPQYAKYANVHLALIDYFKYDNTSIASIFKKNFTDQSWIDKLKTEINQARVIVYCGNDGTGKSGHCFLLDGYDLNDFFHIDWGWSGAYNGYFTLSNLVPSGTGTGGGSGNYSSNQEAVIGIRPIVSQSPVAALSASSSSTSVGQVIRLNDESSNYPNAWSWSISPNNATFVNGTTSTSKFPEVSFSIPGKYTVTLTATNSKGSNTVTKTTFIIVNPVLDKQVCDTMTNFLASERKAYIPIKGGGSLAGHINNLNGFAEQYTMSSSYTHVSGAQLEFARAETNNTTSTIKVNIYQNNNGVPGTILATKLVKISDIKNDIANGLPTKVMFDTPLAVSGLFYIGIETTNAPGDSVGLYTTPTSGTTTNTGFIKLASNNAWCTYEKCWNSLKIHLAISPLVAVLPTANFVINPTSVKTNSNVEIDASSSTNAYAYTWTLNGANISNSQFYKETITYAAIGNYDIKLDAIGGCGNTVSVSKQISVTTSCASQPITSTTSKTESVSYTWNGSTYTQSGTYTFNTKTTKGCDSIATLVLTITNSQNLIKTLTDTSGFFSYKKYFASPKASSVALQPYYYPNASDASKDSIELASCYQYIPNITKSKITYKGLTLQLVSTNKQAGFANVNVNLYDKNGTNVAKATQKVLYNATTWGLYHVMFDKPFTTSEDVYVFIDPQTPNDSVYVSTSGGYRNATIACTISGKTLTLVSPAPSTNVGTSFWIGQEVTGAGIPSGTKITAYNATSKEYSLSQDASSGSNIVVTGINLTFDSLKYQGGVKYYKFPVINGTKNPDFTKQHLEASDVLSWINLGTTDAANWKAHDAHITMYPIIEYAYAYNPAADNTCLGNSKNVTISFDPKDGYVSIVKNPLLNRMAFYTTFLGYTKKSNYFYSNAATRSGSFKDTIDNSNPSFGYTYVANSAANNDSLVITDYLSPYGLYKTASNVINQKAFPLSSEHKLTTASKNTSAIGASDGKASVSVTGGYAPYTYLWNNNKTTSEIIVGKGDYSVDVTDLNNCKSKASVSVGTLSTSTSTTYISSCESYTWNGANYLKSGTYTFSTKGVKGNDSIATLVLTIHNKTTSSIAQSTCGSYVWNGKTYTQSGKYEYITKGKNGCDSIVTLDLTISQPTTSTVNYTACGSYVWNGKTYTQSGKYDFTSKNKNGCDSTATLILTILSPSKNTISQTACGSYTWNGKTYTQSGKYEYLTKGKNGCDSIVTLDLTISQPTNSTVNYTACGSYVWNGKTYTQSGKYDFTTKNTKGCDSIATLILTILSPSKNTISQTACGSYTWNGKTYTQSGKYEYLTKGKNGCDSIVTLDLTLFPMSTSTASYTSNGSYFWNGQNYTQSGIYTFKTKTSNGCDSVATLLLTIVSPGTSTTIQTACESFSWNGKTYVQTGTYSFTTKNNKGLDSIATLLLTINEPTSSTVNQTACGSYVWNGKTYTQSGKYESKTKNTNGCDSIATLYLTINNPSSATITEVACGSYTWNGKTYTQSGKYTYTSIGKNGCDSITTLDLTINEPTTSTVNQTACGSYVWNGKTYTQSGKYEFKTKNSKGCDSIATLFLTITTPSLSSVSQSACGSYTWNGKTYTQSGKYTYTSIGKNGCDSIITLDLTINEPTSSTVNQTACGSFTWNGKTYIQSGKYEFKTKNIKGCDSIATLYLTINNPSSATITEVACGSYTWNGKTYTQSGKYEFTAKNVKGCDSTLTLQLTINPLPSSSTGFKNGSLIAAQANALYQWLDCDLNHSPIVNATNQAFLPVKSGNYAVKVILNTCVDTSSCIPFETQTTGIVTENQVDFNVYPNPNTGMFSISGLPVGTYKIMNLLGGEVYRFSVDNSNAQFFDLSHLAKGVYQVTSDTVKIRHNKVVITE